MKRCVVTLCVSLVLTLTSATVAQQAPPLKGSIEGIVVRAGTGEAIEGAQVTVARANATLGQVIVPGALLAPPPPPPPPPPPSPPPPPLGGIGAPTGAVVNTFSVTSLAPPNLPGALPAVTTDSSGKFVIRDLDAGAYRISVAANGYARQEYGQRVFPGAGTPVSLEAGESLKSLTIPLLQAGYVSGRLRDQNGRPVVGVPVQLVKPIYNASGQRTFQAAGASRTDDRGEYRLYWITPGRYYINAGMGPGPVNRPTPLGGGPASPNEISTNSYTMTFFPGVTDLNFANVIDVQPGSERIGIDFAVTRQQLRRIRGRVIDSATGQAPPVVNVSLAYTNFAGGGGGSFGGTQNYNAATGTFELRDIVPGSYVVQAGVQGTAQDPTRATANTVRAVANVNVADADIENLVLTLSAPVSIPGKLSLEALAPAGQGLERIRPQLRPSVDGVPVSSVGLTAPMTLAPAVDGVFRIDGVLPGEYVLSVTGLPPGHYVKEARFDTTDVLNKPMQFAGGASNTLEISVSPRAAQIDGRVVDGRLQPMAGVQAVLVPDNARKRFDLYASAVTDKNGAFSFNNLPPGDYKVFAWEALESYSYFDPAVLQQYEQKAKSVRISEGSKQNLDIPVIPAGLSQ